MPTIYDGYTLQNLFYNDTDINYGYYNGSKIFEKSNELILMSQDIVKPSENFISGNYITDDTYISMTKYIMYRNKTLSVSGADVTTYSAIEVPYRCLEDNCCWGDDTYKKHITGITDSPKFIPVDVTRYNTLEFTCRGGIIGSACPNEITWSHLQFGLSKYTKIEDILSERENNPPPYYTIYYGNEHLNSDGDDYVYDYVGGLCSKESANSIGEGFTGFIDISDVSGEYYLGAWVVIDNPALCNICTWQLYVSDIRLYK